MQVCFALFIIAKLMVEVGLILRRDGDETVFPAVKHTVNPHHYMKSCVHMPHLTFTSPHQPQSPHLAYTTLAV